MPRSTRGRVIVLAFLVLAEVAIVAVSSTVVKPSASVPDLLPWQNGRGDPILSVQPPLTVIPIPQNAEAVQPKSAETAQAAPGDAPPASLASQGQGSQGSRFRGPNRRRRAPRRRALTPRPGPR
jgi:hypothetical protein